MEKDKGKEGEQKGCQAGAEHDPETEAITERPWSCATTPERGYHAREARKCDGDFGDRLEDRFALHECPPLRRLVYPEYRVSP
jgi:hypothetical protein